MRRPASPPRSATKRQRVEVAADKVADDHNTALTGDEAALYDRQIRLWGMDSQKKIRNARVLLIGLGGLHTEVVKNLVLGGIGAVALSDSTIVTSADLGCQFFLRRDDVGKARSVAALSRIQELNPLVTVTVVDDKVDAGLIAGFDVVSITSGSLQFIRHVGRLCRQQAVKFYGAAVSGTCGWVFNDLGVKHQYSIEHTIATGDKDDADANGTAATKKTVLSTVDWADIDSAFDDRSLWTGGQSAKQLRRSLSPVYFLLRLVEEFQRRQKTSEWPKVTDSDGLIKLRHEYLIDQLKMPSSLLPENYLRDYMPMFGREIAPVAAIVGGALAQDILKAVSGHGLPIRNFFSFDGFELAGKVSCHGCGPVI